MTESRRKIGIVKLVQVQRDRLKVGERPQRYYDPAPLLMVDKLLLTPSGIIGFTAGGSQVLDVHHANHPNSRHRSGLNGISIGFTPHYDEMRHKFGDRIVDGCAGENILIESNRSLSLTDLGDRLVIQNPANSQRVVLHHLLVATPCVEFSQYISGQTSPLSSDQMQATLQFLDNGRRGFYAAVLEGEGPLTVQTGDIAFVEK